MGGLGGLSLEGGAGSTVTGLRREKEAGASRLCTVGVKSLMNDARSADCDQTAMPTGSVR